MINLKHISYINIYEFEVNNFCIVFYNYKPNAMLRIKAKGKNREEVTKELIELKEKFNKCLK